MVGTVIIESCKNLSGLIHAVRLFYPVTMLLILCQKKKKQQKI